METINLAKIMEDSMEKLKIKFIRYKNVVIMDVLEQPEETRGEGTLQPLLYGMA